MFPSLEAPLNELEASETAWGWVFLGGAILAGMLIGIAVPIISHRRGLVQEKIEELKEAEATADAQAEAGERHEALVGKNDELVTQNAKLIDSTEHIAKALSEAREELAETKNRLAEQQRQRHLTPEQAKAIKEAIAPYAGQKISVCYAVGDAEASRYAREFERIFQDAGWICGEMKGFYFSANFENVVVAASKKWDPQKTAQPKALYPLVKVLMDLGLSDNRGLDPRTQVSLVEDIASDELSLRVGVKTIPSGMDTTHATPPPVESPEPGGDVGAQ